MHLILKGFMKKRSRGTKAYKTKRWNIGTTGMIIGIIAILLIIVILYFSFKGGKLSESDITGPSGGSEISPLELAQNKEKYEGKTVKIVNALIPDPLFIYVKEGNIEEKIFIEPTKSIYCLYFNVTGKLERDNTFREWVFLVKDFECVSKT